MAERAVVIGANGFLGRHLCRELGWRGTDVVGAGRSDAPAADVGTYVQADIGDAEAVAALVADADEIYVAAGITGTRASFERYPEFVTANELGLLNVLDALRRMRSRAIVVFPSTRLVYRGSPEAIAEDGELQFKTPYAMLKFAGEQYLRMYAATFDLRWIAFRICVVYGEDIDSPTAHGTVSAFLEQAHRGADLVLFGDGRQRRTLTHIGDVAAAMVSGVRERRAIGDVWNIAGPDVLSVRQIADAIAAAHGVRVESRPWPDVDIRIESGDTVLDGGRLARLIGSAYRHGFYEWLSAESLSHKVDR
jgi:UDP-glucose 4-epimerase